VAVGAQLSRGLGGNILGRRDDARFIVDFTMLSNLRIFLVENYQLEEDVAVQVVIKYHVGRLMNNLKVRYLVDDYADVPTQDVERVEHGRSYAGGLHGERDEREVI